MWHVGRYIGMSIIQGGSGFPFLAPPVFEYLVSGKCVGMEIEDQNIPDETLQFVAKKVQDHDCARCCQF